MADCGATGSAIDRAAAAVVGTATGGAGDASAQAATKAISSFLSGTSVTMPGSVATLMPTAAPERLSLGQQSSSVATMPPAAAGGTIAHNSRSMPIAAAGMGKMSSMDEAWNSTGIEVHQQFSQPAMMAQRHQMHVQHHATQHQAATMQMQMQMQQMQMAQQMQIAQQMQMTQQMAQMQKTKVLQQQQTVDETLRCELHTNTHSETINESVPQSEETVASTWHDGLEEEFRAQDLSEGRVEDDVVSVGKGSEDALGHEGLTEGATIEQLAEAWADAEADFSATDLASAHHLDEHDFNQPPEVLHPYEFGERSREWHGREFKGQDVDVNLMEEGMRHFNAGNMREAISAFERELQCVNPDNADAWRMLGRCHAENDEDKKAIACLERAVDRDPYSPEALLALGVSYVNELDHTRALRNLKGWITHNPKYAGLDVPSAEEDIYGDGGEHSQFDEVQKLLLRALEYDATDSADVREALGVVFNVSRDYSAAVDSFRAAIDSRPDDYQLWNKLGATLANGDRSEEALPAYHKALQLKPKYARAWLNMAISHSNLHNYDEAARCYLQTLSLNPSAVHCWSYLRIALTCSERWDLLPLAAAQDLSAFHEHFDFVKY